MKVTDRYLAAEHAPVVICDFSPPRGADPGVIDDARKLAADFICVAYNPGKAVRADSAWVAHEVREKAGRDVVFNLGTRDMNRLAIETHLLGAHLAGLENVLVIQGDPFTEREKEQVTAVGDFTATGLIAAMRDLNQGLDYKGLKLRTACDFCIGGAIDLSRPFEREVRLAHRRAAAGAHFFVTQPIFDLDIRERFLEAYEREAGAAMSQPVFWGLQVLTKDGIVFGDVPEQLKQDLDAGRDGVDIALELWGRFAEAGVRGIYLVPPILRGGIRGYDAAGQVLEALANQTRQRS